MLALHRLLSLRYLRQRWDRSTLIILSIALGVATLVSARILNRCIEEATAQTTTPLRGLANLYVDRGELGVPRALADELRAANVPGVKSIQPVLFERITLPTLKELQAVLVGAELESQFLTNDSPLGVTFTPTVELPRLTFMMAQNRRLVVLTRDLFVNWQATGSPNLTLRFGTLTTTVDPIGVLDFAPNSPLKQLGLNIVGLEITQAARFVRPQVPLARTAFLGSITADDSQALLVTRHDVYLQPGADVEDARTRLQAIVGGRAAVNTLEMQGASTEEIVSGLQLSFLLCSLGAMVVGLFLVYNALSVSVAERRHDIGVMRSLGATRSQIIRLFLVSALLLGTVGSLLGVPLGTWLAQLAIQQFRTELTAVFLNPDTIPAWPTWGTCGLAFVAGVLTAVVAALVPAIQASTAEPADAVRRSAKPAGGIWIVLHYGLCALLIGGGIGLVFLRKSLPNRVGAFGGMMSILIGLLLAAPIIVSLLVRLMQPLLRQVLSIESRIAADNLLRSPGRTGIVIGAMGAAVAVMVQTAGVARSNEVPIVRWLTALLQADQYVFAGSLATATSTAAPLQTEDWQAIAALPSVERTVTIRYRQTAFNNTIIFITALDVVNFADGVQQRNAEAPHLDKLRDLSGRVGVVMSENFGQRHSKSVGDVITLPGRKGLVELPILGVIPDYSWARGTLFFDRPMYAQLMGDDAIDAVHVFLRDPNDTAELREFTQRRALTMETREALMRFLFEAIDRGYKLAYLQQIVVGVVASLGVVTALLISVLQRKRELGLLLAIGATPRQIVQTVLAEAALMGFFGTLLGVLIGVPMEWYIMRVLLVDESGFLLDVLFPWRQAGVIAAGSMLIATLAGLLPAWHAVRIRIPDAIQYE